MNYFNIQYSMLNNHYNKSIDVKNNWRFSIVVCG